MPIKLNRKMHLFEKPQEAQKIYTPKQVLRQKQANVINYSFAKKKFVKFDTAHVWKRRQKNSF